MPETQNDIMTQLREATASLHNSAEAQISLMKPDLTLEEYKKTLERYFGFYRVLEPALESQLDHISDLMYEGRKKSSRLESDLRALGHSDATLQTLALCNFIKKPANSFEALGAAYVFEGATLGGQLMAQNIVKVLKLDSAHGASFIVGYGTNTGPMWQQFKSCIQREVVTTEQKAQTVAWAQLAFEQFLKWMSARS